MSDFLSRFKDGVDKSVEASRDALLKMGEKVQTFGDKSVVRIEITQLEAKVQKEYQKLGAVVYDQFNLQGVSSIERDSDSVSEILTTIRQLKIEIENRENALKELVKEKDSDVTDVSAETEE